MKRWRPLTWLLVSLACFIAVFCFWRLGNKRPAQNPGAPGAETASTAAAASSPAAIPHLRMKSTSVNPASTAPIVELKPNATNAVVAKHTNAFPYRLSNTTKTVGELSRNNHAILLENALIDSSSSKALSIPDALKSHGDPGAYIVQANGPITATFREELQAAGASVVSYIPNASYLIRASESTAQLLGQRFKVIPWEPYFKVKSSLMPTALDGRGVSAANVAVFPDAVAETRAALDKLGITVASESRSPFGIEMAVQNVGSVASLAGLPGVEEVEPSLARLSANDLTRVIIGETPDVFTPTNYLNLTGSNVWVAVADSWIPTNGPTVFNLDLTNIKWPAALSANGIADNAGHATHVGGIIAGSGMNSPSNAVGSQPGANFRGKAPLSTLWALPAQDPLFTDAQLQESAANTNALISNNSWGYGTSDYNLAAASYDQAVRDSVPGATGSQSLIYVFAAGNNGQGDDSGLGGVPDSLLSPAVAKNVISIGASELPRGITNNTFQCDSCNQSNKPICTTNQPWLGMTDSSNQVARFSSRGNVGIGVEGDFGRFKPDLIAPGTFVVSTRSMTWDTNAYYSPITVDNNTFIGDSVGSNGVFNYSIFVPCDAYQLNISAVATHPTNTDLLIYVKPSNFPQPPADLHGTNFASIPDATLSLTPVETLWYYTIGNTTNVTVTYNVSADIFRTNELGDYFAVLSTNLNDQLITTNAANFGKLLYRYESGTSMSAPAVSGTLALMEDYFTNQMRYTPSPALMKALLINGARSINSLYDFQVKNDINYQGWGLVNLTNSLPMGLTNTFPATGVPMLFVDQNPTNALATGDSRTFFVTVNSNAQTAPLRVTLVWTDPPGNPAASIKLVNNLDLIVTNLADGNPTNAVVYFGNDFPPGNLFTSEWDGDTNNIPRDNVNNVENVYIPGVLGSNYSITVVAHDVNVNAVTSHTNGIVQDYALVVSSANGDFTNALVLTSSTPGFTNYTADLTAITNQFGNATDVSGGLLLDQRVGASSPLQGTNTLSLTNQNDWGTNGQITAGVSNQWHFYVITNSMGTNATSTFTNAAFGTFLPTDLSIPPVGVNAPDEGAATRPEADIDLYVARGPNAWGLTNLDPTVIAGADKSLGRGGTEVLIYSNAQPDEVFYVGVKSEDQEAADYGFFALFALNPFSSTDSDGREYLHGINVPTIIPDGTPGKPGIAYTIALAVQPINVRRVVVTNFLEHENFGDLLGTLTHSRASVVLNNHTFGNGTTNQELIYEDNDEGDIPGSQHPDGPGSLRNFIGQQGIGLWLLQEEDNALFNTGRVDNVFIKLDPQQGTNGVVATIPPGRFFYDFIDVPPNATNLTVCVNFLPGSTGPVQLYLRYGDQPTTFSYDYTKQINSPGDCLSISRNDLPPLKPGRYYVGIFNPTAAPQTVRLTWTLGLDPNGVLPTPITTTNGITQLPDDAVTNNTIFITNNQNIVTVNVGVVLKHPRVSDLDLTLVSPTGQRILLFENRGGPSATNMGHLNITTNFFGSQSAGDFNASSNTIGPVPNSGVLIIDYNFHQVPDSMDVYYDGIDIFSSGLVSNPGPYPGPGTPETFVIPYGPGASSTITIVMNKGGNSDTNTVWEYTPRVVTEDFTYLTFTDDTNLTQIPIKFATPPYDAQGDGTNFAISDFESATNGEYIAPTTISDTNGGWTMTTNDIFIATNYFAGTNLLSMATNEVSVVTDPNTAAGGSNYLALARGSISRSISLNQGKRYTINYLYRGPGAAGWWRGEGNASDSADPETLGNNGSLIGRFNFPAGEVGQAFAFEDSGLAFQFAGTNTYVQVRQSASLDVGKGGGFTVEGWINPTNITFQQPLVEWLAPVPTNTVVNGQSISNLVIVAGPFLNPATGHYYYLLGPTNWTTSELWANALGGHLAEIDDANEQNWVYDTFSQFGGGTNYTMWIGLTNRGVGNTNFVWSTGVSNLVYTNWDAGQPTNCASSHYVAMEGPTNAQPGLWTVLDNNGLTCGGSPTNKPFGVVEVNQIQTNGVQFWISVTNAATLGNGRLYANIVDTNSISHEIFSAPGLVQSNVFQHVALTYNTNTGLAMLYYAGTNVATTNLGVFVPKTGGDVLIGKDISRITNNFFWGRMDEMSIYSRFLSPAEIRAIYQISASTTNRNIGKFDPSITPAESLAEAEVSFNGVTNLIFGNNRSWQVQGFALQATSNSVPLQITGLEPGMLLDSFNLAEHPPGNLYYLPEQALQALVGSNAFGNWTLEIRDARTGAVSTSAELDSWQLQFILQTNIAPPIVLTPQTLGTNTVPPGQIAYFSVDVPSWANFATNILISATAPVDLLFNQNTPPGTGAPGDFTFVNNGTTGSQTLSANPPLTTPPLLRGQHYYLGVRNNGTVPSTVVVQVNFDITTLSNGVPVSTFLNTNDLERPFVFNVASNAMEATFQLLKLTGNADLVLRKGLPLPGLLSSDYGSFSGTNADETIYVLTNSLPVPLSAGPWYLDVIKRASPSDPLGTNIVRYAVLAKELDPPAPNIINLTNRVPLNFTAGPGAALTNFFKFSVTNFPLTGVTNLGLRFELFNQSGNGDLTVQTNALPLAPPFLQSSRLPGNTAEIIFIHTNSALTNLNANWYLGVPNNETNAISFTILAEIDTNTFASFPTAEGAGASTRGGAFGTNVYHVTNLQDSGPGSLRAAVSSTNSGTVVFDVAGTVNLASPLYITNSFMTIAGQTAPGDGVTVAGATTYVQGAHDIILRYLRFRPTGAASNLVIWSSSFEGGVAPFEYHSPAYFDGGWHVDSGSIDLLTNGPPVSGSVPYDGAYFIDINGGNPGSISTNIPTVPGTAYSVSFAYAKNPNAGFPTSAALLANGQVIGVATDNQANSFSALNWRTTSFVYTATSSSTLLAFTSTNTPGASGLFLDAVSLKLAGSPKGPDSLQFTNASSVIADHVSAGYGGRDDVSVLNSSNVTVQWSVVAESLNTTNIASGGSEIRYGAGDVTFHHNLYADNYSGNPAIGEDVSLDFVNNVIFNWGIFSGFSTNDLANNPGGLTNFLNYSANYLIAGSNSISTNVAFWGGTPDTWIFQTNNVIDTNQNSLIDGADTSWRMFSNRFTQFSHPFGIPPTVPDEAFIAYERVLDFAGNSMFKRDLLDRSLVQRARLQPANTNVAVPVLSGMIAWWKAEGNALDLVGGNNGTLQGGVSFTPGEVGQAFAFNPTSYTAVDVPDSPAFVLTNAFTIEGWVRPTANGYVIFFRGDHRPGLDPYSLSMQGNNILSFAISDNLGNSASLSAPLTYNTWWHVAATFNSGEMQLYTNGVLAAQTSTAVVPIGNLIASQSPGIGIGNVNDGGNNFPFVGDIDEIAVYKRALSACEIAAIYNAGSGGKQSIFNAATNSPALNKLPFVDVDQDGIPDFWEITLNEFPTNASSSLDRDGDGYTDLEEYINWLGVPHGLTVTNTTTNVDLYVMSGNTGNLLFGVANGTNGTVYLTNNNLCAVSGAGNIAVFTPAPVFGNGSNSGFASFSYMVTNTDTMAYFGPVTVSMFVSAVPITNVSLATFTFTNPPNVTMDELTTLMVTNTASTNGITYTLINPPTWATIDPVTGIITLSPLEPDGPTNVVITTAATDSSAPPATLQNTFTVTVNEINLQPFWQTNVPSQTNYTIPALTTLVVTNTASDSDIPINPLTYQLIVSPLVTNAIISTNGIITWTPILVQAPGIYTFETIVTDTNPPAVNAKSLSNTNFFTVTVLLPAAPLAFTQPAQAITGASAQLNGMATPDGLPTTTWFEWGTDTLYGNQTPPVNVGSSFSVVYTTNLITGLTANVPYHFRLVASNALAVVHGFDQILDEARVVVWGADYVKQAEVPPGLSNVVAIAGAYDHGLALKNNETVVAWGDNTFNQTNVPPGLNNALAVAGGQYYSMALRNNGTVTSWGGNILNATNVPAGLNNVVMIAGGAYASLALQNNGFVVAWGPNLLNVTNVPSGLSNVVEVAGGSYHSLAIKNDGRVVVWGDNSAGQTNVPPSATNVVAIAGGNYHSLALRYDGTVVAWGDNSSGQSSVPPGLSNVVAIAAGGFHSMALKSDGTVIAWGDDSAGQSSVPVGLSNVVAISSGYFHSMAITPTLVVTNPVILPITNGVPQTNSVLGGSTVFYRVNVPANADAATNTLLFTVNGPLNVWYSTNVPPTVGNPADFLLITNSTAGTAVVDTATSPQLMPGTTYYLGVQNTNNFAVSYAVEVDFHLLATSTNTIPISGIIHTNINGTNGFLLVWFAPTNDLFQVQWTPSLLPTSWNTFTNIIGYNTNTSPTTGEFQFFDDGSQTGGVLGSFRFYRLILLNSGTSTTPLTNGVPSSNSITSGALAFYRVDVPANANYATNSLLSATGPLNIWFSTNVPPTVANGSDFLLISNAASGSFTSVVGSVGPPFFVPGTTYYLGVQNTNGSAVSYSIEVNFHLTGAATNTIPISSITTTNINGTNNFLLIWIAPTNDLFQVQWTPSLFPASWSSFTNIISYSSVTNLTNGIFRFVDDGSQTGGFGPFRGYRLILLNSGSSSAGVIPLTNGVPLNFTTGVGLTNFFSFDVTQTNAAVLFELYNLTGNGDLTLQRSNLPLSAPYFSSSTNAGTNYEQIVIRTNVAIPNINAISWFLGVPNQGSNPVNYTIRAVVPTNGLLVSGLPINTAGSLLGGSNVQLAWGPTVLGEKYEIRTNASLTSTNWGALTDIVAAGTSATFTGPISIGTTPTLFYRVAQVP